MVMLKTNTQTITLDGSEQEVRFNRNYPYFWVQNQGDSDVLISVNSNIAEGKDGVIVVPSDGTACTMHNYDHDRFYLLGTGNVQVMGTSSAHNPFKSVQKGGGSGGSYTLPVATTTRLGGVRVDGKTITADENGTISAVGGGTGGGEENVIESIKVNGTEQTVNADKSVDITIPAPPAKVSELENDAGYLTDIPSEYVTETELNGKGYLTAVPDSYATKTYVGEQIANADHLTRSIVTTLPTDNEASENVIYMLKVDGVTGDDKYREYMKIDGTVQLVGDTSVDLSDYAKTADIPTSLPANGGNADTVNNHTVNADVPEDAVFTDTIYDDTQIKSDIANKVDKVSGKSLSTNDLTNTLKSNYDKAYTHSQSTHAITDATKVEKSATNGNIKINGTETVVYTHPSGTNPHGTTKSDVGLGNVGNFKAVSTVANQGLSDTEKANARANIGAGSSSFSGNYNDLTNKPTIPIAVTESTVSGWGFTKNIGTVTGVKINNTTKSPVSGTVDLGTVLTSLPTASTSNLGGVKVDGTTITADENGVISAVASGGSPKITKLLSITKTQTESIAYTPNSPYTNYKYLIIKIDNNNQNTTTGMMIFERTAFTVGKEKRFPFVYDETAKQCYYHITFLANGNITIGANVTSCTIWGSNDIFTEI